MKKVKQIFSQPGMKLRFIGTAIPWHKLGTTSLDWLFGKGRLNIVTVADKEESTEKLDTDYNAAEQFYNLFSISAGILCLSCEM